MGVEVPATRDTLPSGGQWADIQDEDDDFLIERGFDIRRKDGLIERVSYFVDDDGQDMKSTNVVKSVREIQRINKEVYVRQEWPPLAPFEGEEQEEDNNVSWDIEEYNFHIPKADGYREESDDSDDDGGPKPQQLFLAKTDFRKRFAALQRAIDEESAILNAKTLPDGVVVAPTIMEETKKIWRAPWQKRMESGQPNPRSHEEQYRDECTVRVTNLAEHVTDQDLRTLFEKVGSIRRVYLAKHKDSKFSKGFAFITYAHKESAQSAIATLNRHGYDNLLLSVEAAKQSNRPRDSWTPAT